MSRETFNCNNQRTKDVQNFIFTGCNVVEVIKEMASIEEEVQSLENMKKRLEHTIDTIKNSMIQYAKANGSRSRKLDYELNEKEEELNKLLTKLQEKNESLNFLKDEYLEYIRYIQDSPYKYDIFQMCLKINIQHTTKDEFLTILIAIFGCVDKYSTKIKILEDLKREWINIGEEEYRRLIDCLKTIDDVVKYIKNNY